MSPDDGGRRPRPAGTRGSCRRATPGPARGEAPSSRRSPRTAGRARVATARACSGAMRRGQRGGDVAPVLEAEEDEVAVVDRHRERAVANRDAAHDAGHVDVDELALLEHRDARRAELGVIEPQLRLMAPRARPGRPSRCDPGSRCRRGARRNPSSGCSPRPFRGSAARSGSARRSGPCGSRRTPTSGCAPRRSSSVAAADWVASDSSESFS